MSTISSNQISSTFSPDTKMELAPWSLRPQFQYRMSDAKSAIQTLRALSETTGLPFLCVDTHSGSVVARTSDDLLELLPWAVRSQLPTLSGVRIIEQPEGLVFYVVPLPELDGMPVAAVGYVLNPQADSAPVTAEGADSGTNLCFQTDDEDIEAGSSGTLRDVTRTLGWSDTEHEQWRAAQPYCEPRVLRQLLTSLEDSRSRQSWMQSEISQLIRKVERAWDEIGAVHKLTHELHLTRSSAQMGQVCLDRLCQLIGATGNLLLIGEVSESGSEVEHPPQVITHGSMSLNATTLQDLLNRFPGQDWSEPLVQNDVGNSLLGADQQIHNFILARISSGTLQSGWILLCNLPEGREFGKIEATLLQSISTLLGTHRQNRLMYHELEDLLMQFVSSLVSTLDAKDPYTRGHSERVASIARRLGQELGLPERDLKDIYQAGLLHDIGKIGVNDAILQKEGSLTDEEFDEVKKHPEIGYRILSGLKSLRPLLPGVRNHHENYSGSGYPDGLAGERIPLMARILAVADAYDAMRSDRPYRTGIAVERIEEMFHEDKGHQWDPAIIKAYFQARDEVFELGQGGVNS